MHFKICCMNLSLAVRMIAMLGIITSLVIVNLMANDFLRDDNSTIAIEAILGVEWRVLIPFESVEQKTKIVPLMLFFYSIFYCIASLALILSTIIRNKLFTCPWIFCETINVTLKFISIMIHFFNKDQSYKTTLISFTFIYLVISLYFLIVVFLALRYWSLSDQTSLMDHPSELTKSIINEYDKNISMDTPAPLLTSVNYII